MTVKLPAVRLVTEIPLAAPVDEMLGKEKVPLSSDKKTAVPVELATFTSLTLTPVIAPAGSFSPVVIVELMPRPRTVALVFNVTVLPRFVIVAFALFIAGNAGIAG